MRPPKDQYPRASIFAVDSTDGILSTGPVVKELHVCLPGLGNVKDAKDLAVISLSAKDAVRLAMQLLANLNFEDKWL